MEEHLRAEESFVANVNFDEIVVKGAMNEFLELSRLDELSSSLICLLLIKGIKLFENVLAHIAVLLLNLGCNLI